jgi:ribose transport system permease protein
LLTGGLLPVFTRGGPIYVPFKLFDLYNFENMFPVLVLLTLIFGYLFEYTKLGYYSKAIGENEVKARNSGVPVEKMKILAYVLCGVMAGIAGVFTLSRVGGVDVSMGNFFELEVMLAIFTGGVPVTGGMPTRIFRLFVGALTIGVLVNGLTLYGVSAALAEGLKGLMLIGLVFLTARFTRGREAAIA